MEVGQIYSNHSEKKPPEVDELYIACKSFIQNPDTEFSWFKPWRIWQRTGALYPWKVAKWCLVQSYVHLLFSFFEKGSNPALRSLFSGIFMTWNAKFLRTQILSLQLDALPSTNHESTNRSCFQQWEPHDYSRCRGELWITTWPFQVVWYQPSTIGFLTINHQPSTIGFLTANRFL